MMQGVTGYVLAGGRSSRMGQDKAMLDLCGRPLIERAVNKLRGVTDRVCIAGNRPDLAEYAEVVPDLREGCGPLAAVEALLGDARTDWALLLAVDMPFVPIGLLRWLTESAVGKTDVRAAMFSVGGAPQPALALLHRDVTPYASDALDRLEFRLLRAMREAATGLAARRGVAAEDVLWVAEAGEAVKRLVTETEWLQREHWFVNLNTAEEFAAAAGHAETLLQD